jgi:hypothetical protein
VGLRMGMHEREVNGTGLLALLEWHTAFKSHLCVSAAV